MTWQTRLIEQYPNLFVRTFRGAPWAPGYPVCGDGWEHIVTRMVERVAAAADGTAVQFTHIAAHHGALRVHWTCRSSLPHQAELAIQEAIELAEARSGCTCFDCGAEGRLFATAFVLAPACKAHERGVAIAVFPGFHDVHLRRAMVAGRSCLVRSRYDRASDAFVDLPRVPAKTSSARRPKQKG